MLTIRAQFYYLRLFLGIENVFPRPLPRVEGGGGGKIKNWKRWAILPRKKSWKNGQFLTKTMD